MFAPFSVPGANLTTAKAAYCAVHLVGAAMLVYKLRSMGLLPVTSADWVSLLTPKQPVERSSFAADL